MEKLSEWAAPLLKLSMEVVMRVFKTAPALWNRDHGIIIQMRSLHVLLLGIPFFGSLCTYFFAVRQSINLFT